MKLYFFFLCLCYSECSTAENPFEKLKQTYVECLKSTIFLKCLKNSAVEILKNTLAIPSFEIVHGVRFVKDSCRNYRLERVEDFLSNFLASHRIELNVTELAEEGRGRKKKKNRYTELMMGAVAIKGVLMAIAYNVISAMSGTAIIVAKMTLIIGLILGLKSVVGNNREQTTIELVKYPYHRSHRDHQDEDEFRRKFSNYN